MTQAFYAGFGTAQQPTFVGYVKDGAIYSSDASGQQVPIGVATKVHDDLKADYDSVYARCQEYYDRLVKLGEIVPELTGEALIKAQADELARATQLISQMSQNQEHLLSVIKNMAHAVQPAGEEERNEPFAHNSQSDAGDIAAMETDDSGIRQGAQPVQKHKAGSAKGGNRKKSAA